MKPLQKRIRELETDHVDWLKAIEAQMEHDRKQLDELRRLCKLWRADFDLRSDRYREIELDNPRRLKTFWFRFLRDSLLAELQHLEKGESVLKGAKP